MDLKRLVKIKVVLLFVARHLAVDVRCLVRVDDDEREVNDCSCSRCFAARLGRPVALEQVFEGDELIAETDHKAGSRARQEAEHVRGCRWFVAPLAASRQAKTPSRRVRAR